MDDIIENEQDWENTGEKPRFLDTKIIIKMAKRLRLDLNKFGGLNDYDQEEWKSPLTDFIIMSYERRFGRYAD